MPYRPLRVPAARHSSAARLARGRGDDLGAPRLRSRPGLDPYRQGRVGGARGLRPPRHSGGLHTPRLGHRHRASPPHLGPAFHGGRAYGGRLVPRDYLRLRIREASRDRKARRVAERFYTWCTTAFATFRARSAPNRAAAPCASARWPAWNLPRITPPCCGPCASVTGADWTLDLVGDGPLEPRIRRLAASLGHRATCKFSWLPRGSRRTFWRPRSCSSLSSRSEALPRSILEAMRAGLPVVAADVGGVREAVVHGSRPVCWRPRATFRLSPRPSPGCWPVPVSGNVSAPPGV